MDYQFIETLRQYLYLGELILIAIMLYGYVWYMYKSEKAGKKDYEKFARLALDDELTSKPIQQRKKEA